MNRSQSAPASKGGYLCDVFYNGDKYSLSSDFEISVRQAADYISQEVVGCESGRLRFIQQVGDTFGEIPRTGELPPGGRIQIVAHGGDLQRTSRHTTWVLREGHLPAELPPEVDKLFKSSSAPR